jgi:hypothetical protein
MMRISARCKIAIMSVMLLGLCFLSIAWIAPSGPSAALPSRPVPDGAGSPADSINVVAIFPGQVYYGQAFILEMIVSNYGNTTLRNVHLNCKVNPGNYFVLQSVDQPFILPDQNSLNISLDDIPLGGYKAAHIFVQVPPLAQVPGEWTRTFHFDFTKSCDWSPQLYAGTVNIVAGHGKLLVQTVGFE